MLDHFVVSKDTASSQVGVIPAIASIASNVTIPSPLGGREPLVALSLQVEDSPEAVEIDIRLDANIEQFLQP